MNSIAWTRSPLFPIAALIAVSLVQGCSDNPPLDAASLGRVAAEVESASPEEATKILSEKGYDEMEFRQAVEEFMVNPDSAVLFARAYNSSAAR